MHWNKYSLKGHKAKDITAAAGLRKGQKLPSFNITFEWHTNSERHWGEKRIKVIPSVRKTERSGFCDAISQKSEMKIFAWAKIYLMHLQAVIM